MRKIQTKEDKMRGNKMKGIKTVDCLSRWLLLAAIAVAFVSCSKEEGAAAVEEPKGVLLTVTTYNGDVATRTYLDEQEGSTSPWAWVDGDKLWLVDVETGENKGSMSIVEKVDDYTAKFSGTVDVVSGRKYRFYYMGADHNSKGPTATTTMTIDLASQEGDPVDAGRMDIMSETAIVTVNGGIATIPTNLKLKKAFAVAHFKVSYPADASSVVSKIGVRGAGVYSKATLDVKNGTVSGLTEAGLTPGEDNVFVSGFLIRNNSDVYVTLVPGTEVAPVFDFYFSDYEGKMEVKKTAPEYLPGTFTVSSAGKKVKFTRSNLQYVLPGVDQPAYTDQVEGETTGTLPAGNIVAGTFYRKEFGKGIEISCSRFVGKKGYYKLADNQWDYVNHKNEQWTLSGDDIVATPLKNDDGQYVMDLFAWGTGKNPVWMINNSAAYGVDGGTQGQTFPADRDWGTYAFSETTRTLTSKEADYLVVKRKFEDNSTFMYAEVSISDKPDLNGNAIKGLLVFADGTTIAQANAWGVNNLGTASRFSNNSITSANLGASGGIFLPASGGSGERPSNGSVKLKLSDGGVAGALHVSTINSATGGYRLLWNSGGAVNVNTTSGNKYGKTVRLVKDVE